MQQFTFPTVKIKASSVKEANQKMKALGKLASQLDGTTLSALAENVPRVLKNPDQRTMVKQYLGLK